MAVIRHVLLRKLLRDLWDRKGSLLALVAIVAVGVACLAAMAAVYRDLDGARRRYYADRRLADFAVKLKRGPEWIIDEVAAQPNVRHAAGRISVGVRVEVPDVDEPIVGTAISMPVPRRPVLNDVLLRSGVWFSGPRRRETILNHEFARANGLKPGSRIRVVLQDGAHELLVVGTAMSPEFIYLIPAGGLAPDPARFGVLYLPEDFLRDAADLSGAYNEILGWGHDNSRTALDNTLRLIERRLDPWGVTNTTPVHEQPSARFLADELDGLKKSAVIIPVIFLGVAALALNVLMGRLVTQQRTIIGTLRAIGYSRGAILRHYLNFGVCVGMIGGVFGAALGYGLESVLGKLYEQFYHLPGIEAHLYPDLLLLSIGVSVGASVLGTIKGVRAAARLAPADAMRPPRPERCGKVLIERVSPLWRALSFRWKMILRAVLRNPYRSGVSVAAAAISTALVVAVLSMVDSLDYLMRYEFERVSHQDLTVALRDPRGVGLTQEIGRMPSISAAEPQLGVVCDVSSGPVRRRLAVTGLSRGGRLFTPLDNTGRPIVVPRSGIVLSRKLADILQTGPGETIRLRPLIGRRREVEAPITGVVQTYLGLSAYADITYLSRLLGEEWSANVVFANSFDGSLDLSFLSALKKRPEVVGIGRRKRAFEQMKETFGKSMGMSIGVMVMFAGLIAFGSVLNSALVSLSERRREVGTLRVLGFGSRQVAGIFSGESYLLGGVGIAIGLGLGVGLAHLVSMAYNTELYRFPAIVTPSRLLMSAVLMAVFVGLAQAIVTIAVWRHDWLEALKSRE